MNDGIEIVVGERRQCIVCQKIGNIGRYAPGLDFCSRHWELYKKLKSTLSKETTFQDKFEHVKKLVEILASNLTPEYE